MILRSLLTAVLLTLATAAQSQTPATPPDARAEVDALIRVLEDDGARAALIERLKRAAPTAPSAETEPGPSEAVKAAGGDTPS
ncbi:hypothetical protein ACFQ4O_16695, partial [Methylopila musalis]